MHQINDIPNLALNGFTVDSYMALKKKNHLIDDRMILGWCLDLHQTSLLIIECVYIVELDREHRLYVWALTDNFLHKLWLCSW